LLERVLILRSTGLVEGLPRDLVFGLAKILQLIHYSAGEVIFDEGDRSTSMYIIARGRVRVHRGQVTVALLAAGEIFGEMALASSAPRSASVSALEDCELLELHQDMFYEVMAHDPGIFRKVVQIIIDRIQQ